MPGRSTVLLVSGGPLLPWMAGMDLSVAELFGAPADFTPVSVMPDEIATFITTSGRTGSPQAVMQPHRTYVLTGQAFPDWVGLTRKLRTGTSVGDTSGSGC